MEKIKKYFVMCMVVCLADDEYRTEWQQQAAQEYYVVGSVEGGKEERETVKGGGERVGRVWKKLRWWGNLSRVIVEQDTSRAESGCNRSVDGIDGQDVG